MLPFDLHVLGLPPAFTLSQDQTLHLNVSTRPEGFVNFLSAVVVPEPYLLEYSHLHAFFESFGLCYERLLMDSHPPARRPHKSPAHTVKDRGTGLSALFRASSPKCPREPHIIQPISHPSTPCEIFFLPSRPGVAVEVSRTS